jgi:hypothetical protein
MLQACLPLGLLDPAGQITCVASYAGEIENALSGLPNGFQVLRQQLGELPVVPSRVYLTQYFDPIDSLSSQPWLCGGEPIAGQYLRTFGTSAEASLGQIMQNESSTNGWQFIGGVQQVFQGHGVCQGSPATSAGGAGRWVNSVGDSISNQGSQNGAWHPNNAGQAATAAIVYTSIILGL